MEYSVKIGKPPQQQHCDCIVVGVFEQQGLTDSARALDRASEERLQAVLQRGDLEGKVGQTLLLHQVPGVRADRVLLVGLGKAEELDDMHYRKAHAAAAQALVGTGATDAVSYLTQLQVPERDATWTLQQAVLATDAACYRFDAVRSDAARAALTLPKLRRMVFSVAGRTALANARQGVAQGQAIAAGCRLARDLANTPANLCTPTDLAAHAQRLAKEHPIRTRILDEKAMRKLGMGALLAVTAGSRQPPRLIVMEYSHAAKDEKPIVFVGKGITFDAGGISLKPSANMDEMKFDMGGGASVFGTLLAAAQLELPINLVGVVAAAENLPDGNAVKPGDVITTLAGHTVEILNTDAEGRLVLCDALAWVAHTYTPALVVDLATLTGACVVALGHHAHGLFSNTPELARGLLAAGNASGDRAWELPLWEEYQEQLKSEFADFANVGGRDAGAITAASFLHRFMRKLKWAHLDIAGTAWKGKAATGRPVPLLVQFLIDQVARHPS